MGFSSWRWFAVLSKSIQVFLSKNPSAQMSMSVTLQVFTALNVTCVSLCSVGWLWGGTGVLWKAASSGSVQDRAMSLQISMLHWLHRPAAGALMQQQHYRMFRYWLGFLLGFVCCLFKWFLETIHLCIILGIVAFSPFSPRHLPVGKKTLIWVFVSINTR